MTIVYILAAVFVFGILVAVHELGHFAAAKLCGVRVNEFSIGMGPVIFSRERGETQYSFRALPIGGFCAMEGEEDDSQDERALTRQGFWKQFLIFAAGPLMNLLTGFLILLVIYGGEQAFRVPAIAGVAPEFQQYNGVSLEEGDIFWSVNGERVYLYSDVDLLLNLGRGEPLDLVVLRGGEKLDYKGLAWAAYTGLQGEQYQGYGIYRATDVTKPATLGSKAETAWLNTVDFVRVVRLSLKMLFTGQAGMEDLSGPVGIVSTMTEAGAQAQAAGGFGAAMESIFYFAAMLAVNLAVMNLLPIPALDGGHILFLLVDAVSMALLHRKVPAKYAAAINTAGFVVLMGFMLLVTFHDVFKLVG
ncbi:M50 family metallopeptidase [Dysosmobacter sp.]